MPLICSYWLIFFSIVILKKFVLSKKGGSSLIYNTSVRHERQECDTSNTSETWATRVLHESYTNDTNKTRVKKFGFDSDTSKNIFLHPCISYVASERQQGEEQLHSKNCLLEMPCFYAKMRLKSAPQKRDFLMTKTISKSCTLDSSCKCPCTFPHSYAQ